MSFLIVPTGKAVFTLRLPIISTLALLKTKIAPPLCFLLVIFFLLFLFLIGLLISLLIGLLADFLPDFLLDFFL